MQRWSWMHRRPSSTKATDFRCAARTPCSRHSRAPGWVRPKSRRSTSPPALKASTTTGSRSWAGKDRAGIRHVARRVPESAPARPTSGSLAARRRRLDCALRAGLGGESLDLRALERLGREQLLDPEAPLADALLVTILKERVQRTPIGLETVGPEVVPRNCAPLLGMVRDPGHRHLRCADVGDAREALLLRFLERLEQVHRDPSVALVSLAPQDDDVHDREDAGLAVVLGFELARIGK